MREIGGYIELEHFHGNMLHEGALALNCGRNCLAYLIKAKKIKKIFIPYFLCDSVINVCRRENVEVEMYHIGEDFLPVDLNIGGDWLYLVNYYGRLDNDTIKAFKEKYKRVIVDNAQAYFQMPVEGVDTLYTCRKFFGVTDGAFLYTDAVSDIKPGLDESYKRMNFLLGRFERTASEFYGEYADNNRLFKNEPVKKMSLLTENLLRGIDYDFVKKRRTENFKYLHNALKGINKLSLKLPEGAFMYPLYVDNGRKLRKQLQEIKIYIPTLWPYVFESCGEDDTEYGMASDILPIPTDQRYTADDMEYIVNKIRNFTE